MKHAFAFLMAIATLSISTSASAGNLFVWCTSEAGAKRVVAAYKHSSFKGDRLSLAHIHGAAGNKGCGLTPDISMAKFQGKELAPPFAAATTKDGKQIPLFSGVGGRVLVPVNF